MIYYYIIFFVVVICCIALPEKNPSLVNDKFTTKRIQRRAFLLLAPLIFLLGVKHNDVGADTFRYNLIYEAAKNGTLETQFGRLEEGYKLFVFILAWLFEEPQTQFIVYAIFSLIVFVYFLGKNSSKPECFILLFLTLNLYAFYMTGLRQAIAMTICLLAYEKIKEKKFVRFVLIVAIAISFHMSAIFFLPAYFMSHLKSPKAKIPLYIAVVVVAVIYNEKLFMFANNAFDIEYSIEETGNGYVMIGIMAIITAFSFLRYHIIVAYNENNKYLVQLNVIHMGLWILRLFSRTAERPAMFYTFFSILLVEQLIISIKDKETRTVVNLLVTGFFTLYFIYKFPSMGILPYKFFWQ